MPLGSGLLRRLLCRLLAGDRHQHLLLAGRGLFRFPGRLLRGLGAGRVTTLNLEVVQGDPERNLLLVKGAVPGPTGSIVFVRDAVKSNAAAKGADG